MRLSDAAALLGALMLAQGATAQEQGQGQAPHGPLYRVPGADIYNWMTEPERMPDGKIRVWHWVITHGLAGAEPQADGYPFLTEFDCAAGTSARIRSEWWHGERLVRVIHDRTPHRVSPEIFLEARLLRVVCDDLPLEGRVESTTAARRLVPRD